MDDSFLSNLAISLCNESDVEQKFIMPLLINKPPYGAGINKEYIHTKQNIREFKIDKGLKNEKRYFPDYVICYDKYPIVVIEAKSPKESLVEGWREARLYACELNSIYSNDVNPVKIVIATNGKELWYGYADVAKPTEKININLLSPASKSFTDLMMCISLEQLKNYVSEIQKKHKPHFMKKPKRLLGGKFRQDEELPKNGFGESISLEINSIFNPTAIDDRKFLVTHGYITSKKNERNRADIDIVLKAAVSYNENASNLINDTKKPIEIIDAFKNDTIFNNQVMLLIGSVGVGKTTFIDYLQMSEVLPSNLQDKIVWARLDLNNAPLNSDEIYDWVRQGIIDSLHKNFSDIFNDFESLDFIEKLYSVELNKYNKVEGALKKQISEEEYLKGKIDTIENLRKDLHKTVLSYTRFLISEREKVLVIAFDNCDKQQREEQLLMFQVAQWTKQSFRALVLLPLRDETYDHYKDHPPLDTAIKNLSFRIEPPMFQEVLSRRVQLALERLSPSDGASKKSVYLSNGMKVDYKPSERSDYLLTILESVLKYDKDIRRLITGLSGGNIRRALEIFLEFCSSSYITNDAIFKIRNSKEQYSLPLYVATRALMRSNRRYYDSDNSHIKNILDTTFDTNGQPVYFLRLIILQWLKQSNIEKKWILSSGRKGYIPISLIITELMELGFEEKNVIEQIQYLVKGWCITTEDFRIDNIYPDLLISLAPAGYVHLELTENNLTYLSAIAEDTNISDEKIANSIKDRIIKSDEQLKLLTVVENARDLLNYLTDIRGQELSLYEKYLKNQQYAQLTDLTKSLGVIQSAEKSMTKEEWLEFVEKYTVNSRISGKITNIHPVHGIFVQSIEFQEITGLIHRSNLPANYPIDTEIFFKGKVIDVEILNIDPLQDKLYLKLIEE